MADADFEDYDAYGGYADPEPAQAPRSYDAQRWINGAGALSSVALIVGLGVWAYDLAVRDVRGIPVIRALEGPARVAPANPGGEAAMHQGLAVNEITAEGTAAAPAETLTLAPRAGTLADEDQPMGSYYASEETVSAAPVVAAAPRPHVTGHAPTLAAARPTEPLPDGPAEPIIDAPVAQSDDGAAFVAPDVISADIPGISRSPRPATRPAGDPMAEAAAAAVAAAMAEPVLDIAPETLKAGTRLVQIGAYADKAEARLEWDKAATRFGALLEGKRRVIEPAATNGQTFYRLRVEGFDDIDDARRFCAALKAENAECVPAVVR